MKTHPAIALIECSGIAAGLVAADAMIKSAPISVLKTGTIHRGKYLILVGGSVASIEESYHRGLASGGVQIVDHLFLPDVHPRVYDAILGKRFQCTGESLGVIETTTVASVIKSADAGMKGTWVELVELRTGDGLGGKAFALFSGKLEEVETALHLAREAVTISEFRGNITLIPRIHPDLVDQIDITTRFSKMDMKNLEGGE